MLEIVPLILSGLVGIVVGLVGWELIRSRSQLTGDTLLLSLLALASFALGVFIAYLLIASRAL